MRRALLALTATAVLLPGMNYATSPSSRPLEALFNSASAVVVGRVTNVTASCHRGTEPCNRLYIVSVDEGSIKELKTSKGSKAQYGAICSNVPLEINSTYTLFIETPTVFNTADSDRCVVAVDVDGVFERIGSYVYRVGAPDAKIIVDFEGSKYLTNAVVEPDFDRVLDVLSNSAVRRTLTSEKK